MDKGANPIPSPRVSFFFSENAIYKKNNGACHQVIKLLKRDPKDKGLILSPRVSPCFSKNSKPKLLVLQAKKSEEETEILDEII